MKNTKFGAPIPSQGGEIKPVEKFLLTSKMLESGIVPIENATHDISRAFKNVSADEARVLKRKFRKMWRKELKSRVGNITVGKNVPKQNIARQNDMIEKERKNFGLGEKNPTRVQRLARKIVVFEKIWKDDVIPAIEKMTKGALSI